MSKLLLGIAVAGLLVGIAFAWLEKRETPLTASLSNPILRDSASRGLQQLFPIRLPRAEEKSRGPVSILNFGDVLLARDVARRMERFGNQYPFAKVGELIGEADIALANLEGPMIDESWDVADWTTRFSFSPEAAGVLRDAGFDAFAVANNHIRDAGPSGVEQTLQHLEGAGIQAAGEIPGIASRTAVFSVGDERIAVIAFSPYLRPVDLAFWQQRVREAAEHSTFTLVHIHWGREYQTVARESERAIARALVAAGADAIIGHHPHVVQDIELIENRPVFYSLGNFVFDQYHRTDTLEGLAVKVLLTREQAAYELIPLDLGFAQPAPMPHDRARAFLSRLGERSDLAGYLSVSEGRIELPRLTSVPVADMVK